MIDPRAITLATIIGAILLGRLARRR